MPSVVRTASLRCLGVLPTTPFWLRRKSKRRKEATEPRPGLIRRILGTPARAWRRWGPEFRPWKGQAHLFGLAIVSALLMRLAFPRWNVWVVAAFGLAPFLWAVTRATSGKQAFYLGWFFGAVYYYVLLAWLNILVKYNVLMPVGLVTIGLILGLFRGLFAWVAWKAERCGPWNFWAVAAAWVGADYLQSLGDLALPWGYLGHSLWREPLLIQLAAWTGVYGLTLILFWINHLVCDVIRLLASDRGAPPGRQICVRLAILPFFGTAVCLTAREAQRHSASEDLYTSAPVEIGLVQPNIPQNLKLQSYSASTPETTARRLQMEILQRTIGVTDGLWTLDRAERCDLIVWPETAITDDFFAPRLEYYLPLFDDLVTTRFGVPLFFGATNWRIFRKGIFVPPAEIDSVDYNANMEIYSEKVHVSAWLMEPKRGLCPNVYNKMVLVPMAECIPYVQRVKPLAAAIRVIAQMQPFERGTSHTVFTLRSRRDGRPLLRFGAVICYESCYSHLSRALVRNGAELLVIITNDAWYEMTAGPVQHQLEAVFRAVETRRWVARCANHGISCFIDPFGEIVSETELGTATTLKESVRGVKELTFYARWGDVFACLMLVATGGFLLISRRWWR